MIGKPTRGRAVDVKNVLEMYKKGLSMNEIGRITRHSHGAIAYHIHKSGIPVIRVRLRKPEFSTDYLKSLYNQGMSTIEIGEIVNLSPQAIYIRLLKSGVKLRSFSEALKMAYQRGREKQQCGENNANWKGGKSINKNGYIEIRIQGKQLQEHRLIWEKAYGEIPNGWVVHHLNGIRNDNRLENLFAMPRTRHSPNEIIKPYEERIRQLEQKLKKRHS